MKNKKFNILSEGGATCLYVFPANIFEFKLPPDDVTFFVDMLRGLSGISGNNSDKMVDRHCRHWPLAMKDDGKIGQ